VGYDSVSIQKQITMETSFESVVKHQMYTGKHHPVPLATDRRPHCDSVKWKLISPVVPDVGIVPALLLRRSDKLGNITCEWCQQGVWSIL
jgi:hypothetical protein